MVFAGRIRLLHDQHINAATGSVDRVDGRLGRCRVKAFDHLDGGGSPALAQLGGRPVGGFGVLVDQDNGGARLGQRPRDCLAGLAAAIQDYRDAAFQWLHGP